MTATAEIYTKKAWNSIDEIKRVTKDTTQTSAQILVVGLGNTLLCDDGAGIYVAREIVKKNNNPDVDVAEASIGGLEMLDILKGYKKAVIIDAIVTGRQEIGSLHEINLEDLKGGSAMARHQVGLYEAITLGRQLEMQLPEEILIYGVEVQDTMTMQEACTPEVAECIPGIADKILSVFDSQK